MGYLFVSLNLGFWVVMFLIEKWESRTGRISPRKKWDRNNPKKSFLYLQDWNTGSWGDLIGLSLVCCVFGESLNMLSTLNSFSAAIISVSATCVLLRSWKGRPDSGFPDGEKLSYSGKAHLAYTFVQIFIASSLLLIIQYLNSNLLIILLGGIFIYTLSVLADYKQGKLSK